MKSRFRNTGRRSYAPSPRHGISLQGPDPALDVARILPRGNSVFRADDTVRAMDVQLAAPVVGEISAASIAGGRFSVVSGVRKGSISMRGLA